MDQVARHLLELYPGILRPSRDSKLAMGKALVAAIDDLLGGDGIATDGSLTPAGHALIKKRSAEMRL